MNSTSQKKVAYSNGGRSRFPLTFALIILVINSLLSAQNGTWTFFNTGNSRLLKDGAELKWSYEASAVIEWFDRWEDGYATGDLNDDGIADVVLGTAAGDAVAVNGSNGAELWTYTVPNTKTSLNVDIFDVDGDGVVDVVAGGKASSGNTTLVALKKDGSLKWQTKGDYQETTDLAYGDINYDGSPDVAAAIGTYSTGGGQVILFDGCDGKRHWEVKLGSGIAFGIDAKDVNGDGDMEIAVTNYNNTVFFIDGSTNTILWSQNGIYYGRDVIISDINNDKTYEIISVMGNCYCFDTEGNRLWFNDLGVGEQLMMFGNSLLVANPWTGTTSLLNCTNGECAWTRTEAGLADWGDVDGDGQDDIVVISTKWYDPNFTSQHMRAVDASNNLLWEYQLEAEPSGLIVANIDTDTEDEIVVAMGKKLLAFDVVEIAAVDKPRPHALDFFSLYQNYPNPFNSRTAICFEISNKTHVKVEIYNLYGRHVTSLLDEETSAGTHVLYWDGRDEFGNNAPSGLYMCRLVTKAYSAKHKMVLVR